MSGLPPTLFSIPCCNTNKVKPSGGDKSVPLTRKNMTQKPENVLSNYLYMYFILFTRRIEINKKMFCQNKIDQAEVPFVYKNPMNSLSICPIVIGNTKILTKIVQKKQYSGCFLLQCIRRL